MTTTESHGGVAGGVIFDDSSTIRDISGAAVSKIIVYHGSYLNSLSVSSPFFPSAMPVQSVIVNQVQYRDSDVVVRRGGTSGTRSEILLRPRELITIIKGCVDPPLITGFRFVTNQGIG